MFKYLAALAAFFIATSAQAQTVCGDRAKFVSGLESGYGEKPVNLGLASNGNMIEVFASADGTFSIVITRPGGKSCLVAAGDNWASVQAKNLDPKL